MVNISLTLHTKGFFGSVLKSPTQMGSLSINNSVMNISRLGTFKLMWRLTPAIVYNLQIRFLVQRKGPEGLTEAYPERASKEDAERRPEI